jgi:hypothetical protein
VRGWPIIAEYAADMVLPSGLAAVGSLSFDALSNAAFPKGELNSMRIDSITWRSVAVPSAATSSTIVRKIWLMEDSTDPLPGPPGIAGAEIAVVACCVTRVRVSSLFVQW